MIQPKRILIVDDEKPNRDLLKTLLESFGHQAEIAVDGFEALAKFKLDIDLVLLDVNMTGMDGFTVARKIREDSDYGSIPILMVTALTGRTDRLRAVEAGANDFISKPVDMTELRIRMTSLLKMKEAQDLIKRHQEELERIVDKRTASLRKSLESQAKAHRATYDAHLDTIRCLALAAEYKDENTANHIHRMSHYSALLAHGLNLAPDEVELIRYASKMHDVGKIGIPDAILLKPGTLTPEEWEIMKQHTTIGARILDGSVSEILKAGKVMALSHHERWDGKGYPKGLAGESIPVWGRICAVADVFDAVTSDRPYRKGMSNERAYEILKEGRGTHFDSEIIDVFFERTAEITRIQGQFRDRNG